MRAGEWLATEKRRSSGYQQEKALAVSPKLVIHLSSAVSLDGRWPQSHSAARVFVDVVCLGLA